MNKSKKILETSNILKKISDLKKLKKKIVLCHGVFDLLHIGHIDYFKEAKKFGNILIVSVTDDIFVSKGSGRPYFNSIERSRFISSLEVVDFVYVNKTKTATKLIKRIKPHFYVKGPDYKNLEKDITKQIIEEKKAIESVNGKIQFTSGKKYSSSNLFQQFGPKIILNSIQQKFIKSFNKSYTLENNLKFINQLKELNVLVIGEAIIDKYITCDAVGKSGKEPVLNYQFIEENKYAGGSVALANQIAEFCDKVDLITDFGNTNSNLNFIRKKLDKRVNWKFFVKENAPTIEKTRFIDQYTKNKIIGVYDLNQEYIDKKTEESVLSYISKKIKNYDLILVVDYGHGLLTPKLINFLQNSNKFLSVNAQLNSFNYGYNNISKYKKKCNYICIHENELRSELRDKRNNIDLLLKNIKKILNSDYYTITQGNRGLVNYHKNKTIHCPAFAPNVVDRIGSGDTLFALSSIALASKLPIDFSLLFGSIGAANTVSNIGTGTVLSKNNFLEKIQELSKFL
tara:strand:- start:5153 stop:6691 length:1539 start_codon:yes stop_codon:yes gene_type:complete